VSQWVTLNLVIFGIHAITVYGFAVAWKAPYPKAFYAAIPPVLRWFQVWPVKSYEETFNLRIVFEKESDRDNGLEQNADSVVQSQKELKSNTEKQTDSQAERDQHSAFTQFETYPTSVEEVNQRMSDCWNTTEPV
jgi:hypothetical protein